MNKASRTPRFNDYDQRYFPDACEELEDAAQRGEVTLRALARGTYPGVKLQRNTAEGVRTVGYWDAKGSQQWGLDWHRNEGIEITQLERGSLTFATRDRTWGLKPGQFTITRPWQEHRLGNPHVEPSHLRWVIVDVQVRRPHQPWVWPSWIALSASDKQRFTTLLQHNENTVWGGTDAIEHAFRGLESVVDSPERRTTESELLVYTSQLLLAVLQVLERFPTQTDAWLTSPNRAVQMFVSELEDHLSHPWTLNEMSEACRMGRSQFNERFRELTNMTPVEYLNYRRIVAAAEVLRCDRTISITDLAYDSGFQSSQYFATTFKRQLGCSPREYRAHALRSEGVVVR